LKLVEKIEDMGYRQPNIIANCKHEWEQAWVSYIMGKTYLNMMKDYKCKKCKVSKHDWLSVFPVKFADFPTP